MTDFDPIAFLKDLEAAHRAERTEIQGMADMTRNSLRGHNTVLTLVHPSGSVSYLDGKRGNFAGDLKGCPVYRPQDAAELAQNINDSGQYDDALVVAKPDRDAYEERVSYLDERIAEIEAAPDYKSWILG